VHIEHLKKKTLKRNIADKMYIVEMYEKVNHNRIFITLKCKSCTKKFCHKTV